MEQCKLRSGAGAEQQSSGSQHDKEVQEEGVEKEDGADDRPAVEGDCQAVEALRERHRGPRVEGKGCPPQQPCAADQFYTRQILFGKKLNNLCNGGQGPSAAALRQAPEDPKRSSYWHFFQVKI